MFAALFNKTNRNSKIFWFYSFLFLLTTPFFLQAKDNNHPIEKEWNFLVYLAANNNLHRFSAHNLRQMAQVGSSPYLNIIVQLDALGKKGITRYFVERDNPVVLNQFEHNATTTTGTAQSLYEFLKWGIQTYPAKHQAIVLWNHGSGIKDPSIWGKKSIYHRDELFVFNPNTGLLEINREIAYEETLQEKLWHKVELELQKRGIAFNDTYQTYIDNQELTKVLDDVSKNLLGGKKIDLVCMDACHMAMVEIGSQIKSSTDFMTGSEEVEPGSGYNYIYVLKPFLTQSMTPAEFASHVVSSYKLEYEYQDADYTQSAINLEGYEKLEENIKKIGLAFTFLLQQTESEVARKMLRETRRNKELTTVFCDTDYVDFYHFYTSVYSRCAILINKGDLSPKINEHLQRIKDLIDEGLMIHKKHVIKNNSGDNLPQARGLSIYFPTRTIHKSYLKTIFHQKTNWGDFLKEFVKTRKNL